MCRSIFIFGLFAFTPSALLEVHKECLDEAMTYVKDDRRNIEALIAKSDGHPTDFFHNEKTRCYAACYSRMETHEVNANGTLDYEQIEKIFQWANHPQHKEIIEAIKPCANESGETFCDRTYKTFTCVEKQTARFNA